MNSLVLLGLVWLLASKRGSGDLVSAETGPDALSNLRGQTEMSQLATRSRTQTAFPTEWWTGKTPDGSGKKIFLVWATDDPRSWAAFVVSRAPTLPTELARGHGPLTGGVVSALSRRVL